MTESTPTPDTSGVSRHIDQILTSRKVVITCGTGGVGKTTLSAAMALRASLLGKKTLVITIDPAKRLATSLGLDQLGDHATDITERVRLAFVKARKAGALGSQSSAIPSEYQGSLHAIIPDTRRTFEEFVHLLSESDEATQRVLNNPIFQVFAKEFSGANEYMALERLLAIVKRGEYDLIVLDTPPSRNTLAFLNAPRLLIRFFDEKLYRWLVMPANRIVSAGMRKALGLLEKLTGGGFMTHLIEFIGEIFKVQKPFSENLKEIISLLESREVGFVMVTVPAPDTAPEAIQFIETLRQQKLHFDGVALNRSLGYLKASHGENAGAQSASPVEVLQALQERERRAMESLSRIPVCARVPELARDVHSVEDLFHVALALDSKTL